MSLGRDGMLFDYFGGREDLAAGRVRFVGDAVRRIHEDYLRVLRYFRFHGRYGTAPPDAPTEAAFAAGAAALGRLSVERVWSELKGILGLADPGPAVQLMERLGVLPAVLPGRGDLRALGRLVAAGAPADPMLRLAALQPGTPAAARFPAVPLRGRQPGRPRRPAARPGLVR